jgi:hypothetical protein
LLEDLQASRAESMEQFVRRLASYDRQTIRAKPFAKRPKSLHERAKECSGSASGRGGFARHEAHQQRAFPIPFDCRVETPSCRIKTQYADPCALCLPDLLRGAGMA